MFKKATVSGLVFALLLALFGPSMVAWGAINYPSIFGQLTGDCSTAGNNSYATTCSKFNGGTAFGSMAGQAASNVAVTGGSINGATIGATAPAAITGTSVTGTSVSAGTGPVTGGTNTFNGLSTQTGGHIIGTGDYTTSQTLTAANEDVTMNCTAACTATLPSGAPNGQPITVQDISSTVGLVTVAASGTGTKVLTPSGPATSFLYASQNGYQGARWVYHSGPNLWIAE